MWSWLEAGWQHLCEAAACWCPPAGSEVGWARGSGTHGSGTHGSGADSSGRRWLHPGAGSGAGKTEVRVPWAKGCAQDEVL